MQVIFCIGIVRDLQHDLIVFISEIDTVIFKPLRPAVICLIYRQLAGER